MKVIKLDGRHNLYRNGFKYAFVNNGYASGWYALEHKVKQAEDFGWAHDCTYIGKPDRYTGCRTYYIGFNKEETATMVMLQL